MICYSTFPLWTGILWKFYLQNGGFIYKMVVVFWGGLLSHWSSLIWISTRHIPHTALPCIMFLTKMTNSCSSQLSSTCFFFCSVHCSHILLQCTLTVNMLVGEESWVSKGMTSSLLHFSLSTKKGWRGYLLTKLCWWGCLEQALTAHNDKSFDR